MTNDIEVSPFGGLHTNIGMRCDLYPPRAFLEKSKVLGTGCAKYGVDNWRLISRDGHLNHALAHIAEYQIYGRYEDLLHAAVRLDFAIETNPETEATRGSSQYDVVLVDPTKKSV